MSPGISFGLSSGTLALDYDPGIGSDDNLNRDVLQYKTRARTIQPWHPLKKPWEAPFFFEDNHHVFFISTTKQLVPINEWKWSFPFIAVIPPKQDLIIPPILFEPVQIIPDKLGPVISGQHLGVQDTVQIKRFVSEDAYIKKGISTSGTVLFGDTEISATGNRNLFQQR